MHRRDLSDPEWAVLPPHFPAAPPRRGGQWKGHRLVLSGIVHRLRTGIPWRDLPGRYGPRQTVYERFAHLRRTGKLAEVLSALQLRLNDAGLIDRTLYGVDGSNVRASRAAAGAGGGEPAPRRAG